MLLINMVTVLLMTAKMNNLDLSKMKVFWLSRDNEVHEVTNKILSYDF